jgi:hypothetical protein
MMRLSLVHLREDSFKIQKECLFVVTNACEGSQPQLPFQSQLFVTANSTRQKARQIKCKL